MSEPPKIPCHDLDEAIERYRSLGYRLDMIFPADSPREALMSKAGTSVQLVSESVALSEEIATTDVVRGRAGMEYRDLIPGRLGGKVIASHIRLPFGGEVPDSVHYHKIDFQMIYCVRGRIQVVYEDQGPPFWLETGDCILQPPEIRHRVLYSEAGAEVIEVTSPAEHETWIDHEMDLPSGTLNANRDFGGQRFYHFKGHSNDFYVGSGYSQTETELWEMSRHKVAVMIKSFVDRDNNSRTRGWFVGSRNLEFVYVLSGELTIAESPGLPGSFDVDDHFSEGVILVLKNLTAFTFDWSQDLKLLHIVIPITETALDCDQTMRPASLSMKTPPVKSRPLN